MVYIKIEIKYLKRILMFKNLKKQTVDLVLKMVNLYFYI